MDDDGDKYAFIRSQRVAGWCEAMTNHAEIRSRVGDDEFPRRRAVTADMRLLRCTDRAINEGGTANPLALWVEDFCFLQRKRG